MLPKIHALIGLFLSLVLLLIFPTKIIPITLFFFASFLIDADHYIYYTLKEKSFNFKKAYFWFKNKSTKIKQISTKNRKKYSTGIYIFHGIEVIILFVLLGLFFGEIFYFISAGLFLHLILDWTEKYSNSKIHPYKISILYDLISFPKLKKI